MIQSTSDRGELKVENLTVIYGGQQELVAVEDLSLQVNPGEFVCLLGTTGCGKSTVLNVVAGFISPTTGHVFLDGKEITSPGPERGIVFQQHALFPWKTVRGNVEFGLKMKGLTEDQKSKTGQRYINLIGLKGFEDRYPHELSGGMQQRVGIARVLANDPLLLLMDEPFGSVDAQTRMMMQELLLRIWEEFHRTVLFVTHDVDEAILLADRILVMTTRPGQIKEELTVTLARPRGYDMATTDEYAEIKRRALSLIREESLKAMWAGLASAKRAADEVRIGYLPNAESVPLLIAQRHGFFKKEGIKVELVEFESGEVVISAAIAGGLDAGVAGTVPILFALENEEAIRIVRDGGHVGKAPHPYFGLCTRKDSDIRKTEHLRGKTVAVNGYRTTGSTLLLILTRRADVAGSVRVVTLPFGAMARGLQEGRIDAAMMIEPYIALGLADGQIEVLAGTEEIVSSFQSSLVFFARKYIDEGPENVKRFCAAYDRALDLISRNPAECRDFISEFTSIRRNRLEKMVLPSWSKHLDLQPTQTLQKAMIDSQLMAKRVDLRPACYQSDHTT